MTAEQHLKAMIGELLFQLAQLRAENEELRAKVPEPKPKPVPKAIK